MIPGLGRSEVVMKFTQMDLRPFQGAVVATSSHHPQLAASLRSLRRERSFRSEPRLEVALNQLWVAVEIC